jgi:tetratricopeptide (TPR) repeat protein
MQWRTWLLGYYTDFLERHNRIPEAAALVRKEIEEMPADAWSVQRAVIILTDVDFREYTKPNDEVLWKWLTKRPKWEYAEKRLLSDMLGNADQDDLDKFFTRAEKLAKDKNPSRAYALGSIMNRMRHAKRSIALLEYAAEKATYEGLRQDAMSVLFRSYLATGDWKSAEKVFPDIRKRMSWREVPERYSEIAVVAAKAGARDDAMRIWQRAVNVNPTEMGHLRELSESGLKTELVSFYRDLSKEMPSSAVPANALKILTQK